MNMIGSWACFVRDILWPPQLPVSLEMALKSFSSTDSWKQLWEREEHCHRAITQLGGQPQPSNLGCSSVPKGWTTLSILMAVAEQKCYNQQMVKFTMLW